MVVTLKNEFIADVSLSNILQSYVVEKCGISFSIHWEEKHLVNFKIKKIKGDFDFSKILQYGNEMNYDSKSSSFSSRYPGGDFKFHINANTEYKENDYKSKLVNVHHSLWIPSDVLEALKPLECSENSFILPGYSYLTFKYFIHKNDDIDIKVLIDNPFKIEICGKTENYVYQLYGLQNQNIDLSFAFDPMRFEEQPIQDPEINGSRPISILQKSKIMKSSWHEIMSNTKYFDVILISSSRFGVRTHRCILDKFSTVFSKIIAESDAQKLRIKKNVSEFDAEIIEASIDFLYDKFDSINGKESDVFKFASAYGIEILKDACCAHFENSVNAENVCEYIQIAYENEFEDLKQKCKGFIVLNKKEIDSSKLKEIPKDIIVDIFCN